MDVLGTLSMLLDIKWFSAMIGFTTGDASLLRAARSAKIGAKSGRLAKLTKLFKLMEQFFYRKENKEKDPSKIPPAKAVARVLSGVLSRRVAALVMVLILANPLLSYQQIDDSYNAHSEMFNLYVCMDPRPGPAWIPTWAMQLDGSQLGCFMALNPHTAWISNWSLHGSKPRTL